MTEIYLIRHGEAEGNIFRRLHGQYDSLLMPRGFKQLEFVKKRFESIPVDGCFSSDLTRAAVTARSIYLPKGLELQKKPAFRELDVGSWEDLSYGYLDNFYPSDMHRFSHDPVKWKVTGSETYTQYTDRFITAMEQAAKTYDGGTVCIFCHGAVLRGTLMRLFFADKPDNLPLSDNAGVSHLYYDKNGFSYEYLNDNSHIPHTLSTFYLQSWWRKTDNRREANLYFVPEDTGFPNRGEVTISPLGEKGKTMFAVIQGKIAGGVCLEAQENGTGILSGLTVLPQFQGRGYEEQLFGCGVSHFRRLGCSHISLIPGDYTQDFLQTVGLDSQSLQRSIDPKSL